MNPKRYFLGVLLWPMMLFVAFAQKGTLTICDAKYSKTSSGEEQHELGTPAVEFSGANGQAVVYFRMDFDDVPQFKGIDRLLLHVEKKTAGSSEYAYQQEMGIPTKKGRFFVFSTFTNGSYEAKLINKEKPDQVFSTASFRVEATAKPDYKSISTLVLCKNVDDNWNPVEQKSTLKTGDCVCFLYKCKEKIDYYSMMWYVYKVEGNDVKYVNSYEQDAGQKPWRYLATGPVCAFTAPGKYRIVLVDKVTGSVSFGEMKDCFGMTEVAVE